MIETFDDIREDLENKGIVEKKHSILRSGRHSDTYIRKTLITLYPQLYNSIIYAYLKIIMQNLPDTGYDVMTTPAVAGMCFAPILAVNLNKPFMFTEKKKVIEGCSSMEFRPEVRKYIEGHRFIIIEDIVTTCGSVAKVAKSISENGGVVIAVFCLWNRHPEYKSFAYTYKLPDLTRIIESCGNIPIYSIIDKRVDDWEYRDCPICHKINNY